MCNYLEENLLISSKVSYQENPLVWSTSEGMTAPTQTGAHFFGNYLSLTIWQLSPKSVQCSIKLNIQTCLFFPLPLQQEKLRRAVNHRSWLTLDTGDAVFPKRRTSAFEKAVFWGLKVKAMPFDSWAQNTKQVPKTINPLTYNIK